MDTTQDFSDMESDDPEVPFVAMLNQPQISENLTKKKYCQSTRLFFEIFDSDMEMDQTINLVKKVRKFVHNVAFEQFFIRFRRRFDFQTSSNRIERENLAADANALHG